MAAALAVSLVACSPSSGSASDESHPDATNPTGSEAATDNTPKDEPGESYTSPLADYVSPFSEASQLHDRMLRFEEAVATCMAEQGFEYVVSVPPVEEIALSEEAHLSDAPPADAESAGKRGFGIVDDIIAKINEGELSLAIGDGDLSPREVQWESMTDSEREEYDRALYGDGISIEDQGCNGRAEQETRAHEEEARVLYLQLDEDLQKLEIRVASDPRVVDALEVWQRCMATHGFTVAERTDAVKELSGEIEQELSDLIGVPALWDPLGGMSQEEQDLLSVERSHEELEEIRREHSRRVLEGLRAIDQQKIDDLRQREITRAVAEVECGGPYREVEDQVRYDEEDRFLHDNLVIFVAIRELIASDESESP